jgi:hypothetical protein
MLDLFQPAFTPEAIEVGDQMCSIQARPGGLVAAIASALGVGTKSHVTANHSGVSFVRTSLSGSSRTFYPLRHVAGTVHAARRPIIVAVVGAVLVAAGLITVSSFEPLVGWVNVGVGAALLLYGLLSGKKVVLGVVSTGGTTASIKLDVSRHHAGEVQAFVGKIDEWLVAGVGG